MRASSVKRIPKSARFDAEIGLLQLAKLGSEEIGRKKSNQCRTYYSHYGEYSGQVSATVRASRPMRIPKSAGFDAEIGLVTDREEIFFYFTGRSADASTLAPM